jgi:hypothetical protein
MNQDRSDTKQQNSLQVDRKSIPNSQAMLQALRVVLDLPRKPIVLEEDKKEI